MADRTGNKRKFKGITKAAKQHTHRGTERQTKVLKGSEQDHRGATHAEERRTILQGKSSSLENYS